MTFFKTKKCNTTKWFFSKPKNATINQPLSRLGKEAKDEGISRPRTSMIEENFITPKTETPTKGIFGPRLDVLPQGFFGTKQLWVTYV